MSLRLDEIDRPHYVYELHGATGPLYVGLTAQLVARITHHRNHQPWWPEVTHARISRVPNYFEGKKLERERIQAHRPEHNRLMNPAYQRHGNATFVKLDGAA